MSLLTELEITKRLSERPLWKRAGDTLTREFVFKNFVEAVAFINKLVPIAEGMDHHPDITIFYKRVQLSVSTHSEKGITEKDFELTKRIDAL